MSKYVSLWHSCHAAVSFLSGPGFQNGGFVILLDTGASKNNTKPWRISPLTCSKIRAHDISDDGDHTRCPQLDLRKLFRPKLSDINHKLSYVVLYIYIYIYVVYVCFGWIISIVCLRHSKNSIGVLYVGAGTSYVVLQWAARLWRQQLSSGAGPTGLPAEAVCQSCEWVRNITCCLFFWVG